MSIENRRETNLSKIIQKILVLDLSNTRCYSTIELNTLMFQIFH